MSSQFKLHIPGALMKKCTPNVVSVVDSGLEFSF